jgi:hypothetical protein
MNLKQSVIILLSREDLLFLEKREEQTKLFRTESQETANFYEFEDNDDKKVCNVHITCLTILGFEQESISEYVIRRSTITTSVSYAG